MSIERPGILRIGIDIDGCVSSTGPAARQLITERTGIDANKLYRRKNGRLYYFSDWAQFAGNQEALEIINNLYKDPELYRWAPAVPGAVRRLNKWHNQGHQMWFITARPESVRDSTLSSFWDYGLKWVDNDFLIFPGGEDSREQFKARVAAQLALHVIIEDHGLTLLAIRNPEIMIKILLARKYNSLEPLGPHTVRHRSWKRADELIQEAGLRHFNLYSSS